MKACFHRFRVGGEESALLGGFVSIFLVPRNDHQASLEQEVGSLLGERQKLHERLAAK